MALKLPEARSRPEGGVTLRLMPTSRRVAVEGCTSANCLLRRRLTFAFFGETSTSAPNLCTAARIAS